MAIQDRIALLVAVRVCFRAMDSRRPDALQVEIVLWRGTQEHPDPRTIMGKPCLLLCARPADKIDLPSLSYESRRGRRQIAAWKRQAGLTGAQPIRTQRDERGIVAAK